MLHSETWLTHIRSIKRIIFETTVKHNGVQLMPMKVADIKQIAGRAGRYRTADQATKGEESLSQAAKGDDPAVDNPDVIESYDAKPDENKPDESKLDEAKLTEVKSYEIKSDDSMSDEATTVEAKLVEATSDETKPDGTPTVPERAKRQNIGLVTTLEEVDFPIVEAAMINDPEPIITAGLFPPGPIVERFSSYFPPGTPFSYILLRLHELSQVHTRFHLCGLKDQLAVADAIQPVKGLTATDRIIFCAAPANVREPLVAKFTRALATCVLEQKGGSILELPHLNLEVLDRTPSGTRKYLYDLEVLHKCIVLYLWLSYRFSGIFNTRALAIHVKDLVEDAIEKSLSKFSFKEEDRKKIINKRHRSLIEQLSIMYDDDYQQDENGELVKKEPAAAVEVGEQTTLDSVEEEGGVVALDAKETGAEESVGDNEKVDESEELMPEVLEVLKGTESLLAADSGPVDDYDEYPGLDLDTKDGDTQAPRSVTQGKATVTVEPFQS